jgi:hypothetical protein
VPSIRTAAIALLALSILPAAWAALASVGIGWPGVTGIGDDLQDSYYTVAMGRWVLTMMAIAIVNAALVMAASRVTARLAGAGLWFVLAGIALLFLTLAIDLWRASPAAIPRRMPDYSDMEALARITYLLSCMMAAAVVGVVLGWALWAAAWLHGRVRAHR